MQVYTDMEQPRRGPPQSIRNVGRLQGQLPLLLPLLRQLGSKFCDGISIGLIAVWGVLMVGIIIAQQVVANVAVQTIMPFAMYIVTDVFGGLLLCHLLPEKFSRFKCFIVITTVWLIPFIGCSLVLKLVPDVVPVSYTAARLVHTILPWAQSIIGVVWAARSLYGLQIVCREQSQGGGQRERQQSLMRYEQQQPGVA